MSKVTISDELRSQLNGLTRVVELCDGQGQTVGHVVPPLLYKEFLLAWLEGQITPEEIERREQEPPGRSLKEIWKGLGRPSSTHAVQP